MNAARDMRLCGEVDHRIHLSHQVTDDAGVADVSVPEMESRVFTDLGGKILGISGIGKGVEHMDIRPPVPLHECPYEVGADEPRTACYQNRFHGANPISAVQVRAGRKPRTRSSRLGTILVMVYRIVCVSPELIGRRPIVGCTKCPPGTDSCYGTHRRRPPTSGAPLLRTTR